MARRDSSTYLLLCCFALLDASSPPTASSQDFSPRFLTKIWLVSRINHITRPRRKVKRRK
eukprot:SAG31_NODE_3230_length_4516_cov_3.158252_1_plen_60_part_00